MVGGEGGGGGGGGDGGGGVVEQAFGLQCWHPHIEMGMSTQPKIPFDRYSIDNR